LPKIRLSPRALSVAEVRAPTFDLGGKWLHKANPESNFANAPVAGSAGWTEIEIPRPLPARDGGMHAVWGSDSQDTTSGDGPWGKGGRPSLLPSLSAVS
jgi:hypothetical protein